MRGLGAPRGHRGLVDEQTGGGGGGGGIGWDALQWTRIVSRLGTQITQYNYSPLLEPADVDVSVANSPLQQYTRKGGIWRGPSGAGSGYLYFKRQNLLDVTIRPVLAANLRTDCWAFATKIKVLNAPVAGNVFAMSLSDEVATSCNMQIDGTSGPTVFNLIQNNGGLTTRTVCNSRGTIGLGITVGLFYDCILTQDPSNGLTTLDIIASSQSSIMALGNGTVAAQSSVQTNQPTSVGFPRVFANYLNAFEVDDVLEGWSQET